MESLRRLTAPETDSPQTVVVAGAADGPSLVIVSGFGSSTLDYDLSVSVAEVTKLSIDATTSGTIDSTSPTALFEFEPPADQTLVVELKSGETSTPSSE